jgi:drug/metabolite transporter (DMT)-like permease
VIARPDQLWFNSSTDVAKEIDGISAVTPVQRLWAIIAVLVSNFGAATAFTTIRVIGSRAHSLLSVNYYALISTLISGAILFTPFFPSVAFRLPNSGHEWSLLIGIGVFGFGLQFAMTAGLIRDNSPRATNMMYSSVVFGLVADYAIWGLIPLWSSWVGGAIVCSAVVWVAMQKADDTVESKESSEEYGLVPTQDRADERV